MIEDSAKRTLELMDLMDINNIECTFEEVKPYQNGTKRQTFNFKTWFEPIFKNK